MRTLLVVAMVATLVAAVPTSSYAAPGDSPRPTWPDTASLTVTNVTDTGATLSWPAALDAGGVTAYNVYAGADNTTLLGTTANLTINLTGLTPGTPYTVHVEAADADGNESEPLTGTNFSAPTTYTTGASSNPYSIKLADFDEDGDMDIAVANETDSEIGILLGNGDGTFGAVQGWSTGADVDGDGPKNFVVADLNGDTDLDIVAANEYSETVAVVLGDGDGTFQGPTTFAGPIGTHGVAVGSFNAGTTLDIVAVGWGADVPADPGPPIVPANPNGGLFYSGVGDGTFGAPTEFVEGPSSHEVVVADFDDNGNLDLAIADLEDARVLAGTGLGTFGAPASLVGPGQAHDIAIGTLNADAFEDLVIASQTTDQVAVFFGTAGMAFTDPEVAGEFTVADNPKGVSVGDVNNDGIDDLIAASVGTNVPEPPLAQCAAADNPLTLLLGNGTGGFVNWTGSYWIGASEFPVTNGQISVGKALYDATVFDFNGDGWNDLATPAWCDSEVTILLGLGEGGPSNSFTTTAVSATVPGAPAAPNATIGDTTATVTWTAPASDGGASILGYDLEVENLTSTGTTVTDVGLVLTHNATGLTNGDSYRARVRASNAVGDGAFSAWSATFVPAAGADPNNPFLDTDDSVFKDDIIWLANEGITKGCNPPVNNLFCPDDNVTREQMAAFLVRALDLTDDGGGNTFADVAPGSTFESDIAKLATAGITKGCNPPANTNFCPSDDVTREQMAAFLVRALTLTDIGDGNTFIDVAPGSTFESDIAKLATAGITKGCNPPDNTMFCPGDNVTRGQMAAFLHRALGT